jgi:Zn-dependent peptidase ImmA (M78 family)
MIKGGGYKLPASQLTLPGGFRIEVRYRTDKQCRKEAGTAVWGYWARASNGGYIVINKNGPLWRQMKTFGHELVHAVHDYALWLDQQADHLQREAAETEKLLKEED